MLLPGSVFGQKTILDQSFTITKGTLKTGDALDVISSETGFSFTYDSRIIEEDRKVQLNFTDVRLGKILESVLHNDSLTFSIIDKYIVISKSRNQKPIETQLYPRSNSLVTGVIVDEETGDPLPFATIGFKNIRRGTVTNNNGEFRLNIPPDSGNDTLHVSYLGYFGREIPASQATGSDFRITMRREYISIPEIIIHNQIPREIIRKSYRAINENYGRTPAMMTGFYREGVMKKNELQNYSEAILSIYKSPYSGTLQNDQVKILKSRKIENLDISDTLAVRLKAGLSTSMDLDVAKNIFGFISPEGINSYEYRITDIVTYNDESAYVIEFKNQKYSENQFFNGTIYINTNDFGIYSAEFEISPSTIDKFRDSFVSSSPGGFNTWPVSVKYNVSYRKMDGRYFLSHVRADLLFNSKQKRKLFNSQFKVFFEMAVTETNLIDPKRFDKEELAPVHSVFSKTINSYDPDFWGDQDFLRPEENLLDALKNIKVKLREFSEE